MADHPSSKNLDSSPTKNINYTPRHFLLTKNLELSPAFKRLFEFLKIDPKEYDTVEHAHNYCQKNFVRPKGVERNNIVPHKLDSIYDQLEPYFNDLEMIEPIIPSGQYKYLCFNGQSLAQMRRQMEFISKNKKLISYEKIIFAAGERVISNIDDGDPLYGREDVKLETDGAQLLLDQYFPGEDGIVIHATTKGTNLERPNTRSTILEWFKSNPKPGPILMVSNNPFIGYQYLTWFIALSEKNWFKEGGSLDMCGDSIRKYRSNKVAVTLDNIARELNVEIAASKI
ncbi:hypothetical protein M9Y10_003759 [Tritrichomonas musculus]|uniref:Uncharacterized protein n=1 Tax=Tritrichomonas musculus TaxID=1915356 RepID=A0ABR2JQ69_9EUKA